MRTTPTLLIGLLALTTLAGCLGSSDSDNLVTGDETPSFGALGPEPSFPVDIPAHVTGLQFLKQLADTDDHAVPSAAGIWTFGDRVYGSALNHGFWIADISDPEAPKLLWNATTDGDEATNTITGFARDADVIQHSNGHRTLVLATQTDGMHIWDVTNDAPRFLSRVEVDPNHNIAVVPGTAFVFNSQSGGLGRTNDLVDLTDPEQPVVVGTYGTHGCHDITFHGSILDDTFRAYCAGIDRTEIWDLDSFDANAPSFGISLVATVEELLDSPVVGNPALSSAPLRTLHHLAMVNADATVLIIGDEQNGGGEPGGCLFNDGTHSSPTGALWFYDLTNEADPQLLSWISPPLVQPDPSAVQPDPTNPTGAPNEALDIIPNCTAHFGTLVPDQEKLVMAWYSAGVLLIDFEDPSAPTILAQYQPSTVNTWDARIHGGYVFTGDIVRGMDVLKLI